MVTLEARPLLNAVLWTVSTERALAANPGPLERALTQELQESVLPLIADCEKLGLQVAADAAKSVGDAKSTHDLKTILAFVRDAIIIGLNRRKFFEPEPRYAGYFENPQLFGAQVFTSFPSATDDIAEAGTCLALERPTACVMHLMRAAEISLRCLAKNVGVIQPQNDWGSYIREIDKDLAAKLKAAGKRTPDEEFYAEASAQMDHFKRAWRNASMHVDKSYSQQRAEEILLATKSLMVHLAAKIAE